jgi:hypothetical protein
MFAEIIMRAVTWQRQYWTYRVWVVVWCDALAVEKEAHARNVLSLAIAEGVHELSKSRGALDLEEDFVVVVRYLDVQVFGRSTVLGLLLHIWRAVLRHGDGLRAV